MINRCRFKLKLQILFKISNLKVKKIWQNVNHEKIMHLKELDKKHTYFTSKLCDLVEDSFYDRRGDFLDVL